MMEKKRWRDLVKSDDAYHLARVSFFRGRTSRLHTHDFAEIFWIESGYGQHEINGEKKRLAAGDLIVVRPADRHVLSAVDQEGFVLVNLAFPADVMRGMVTRHAELGRFYPNDSPLPVRCLLGTDGLRDLRQELNRLSQAGNRSRLYLERFLLNLFALLSPTSHADQSFPHWLIQACEGIHHPENFAGGTQTFVRLAGRNAEYVARATRKFLGVSPTDYINAIRMDHAARELRLGSKPIIDIALECGINNLAYFYMLFRGAYQTTPRAYRLASQNPVV